MVRPDLDEGPEKPGRCGGHVCTFPGSTAARGARGASDGPGAARPCESGEEIGRRARSEPAMKRLVEHSVMRHFRHGPSDVRGGSKVNAIAPMAAGNPLLPRGIGTPWVSNRAIHGGRWNGRSRATCKTIPSPWSPVSWVTSLTHHDGSFPMRSLRGVIPRVLHRRRR